MTGFAHLPSSESEHVVGSGQDVSVELTEGNAQARVKRALPTLLILMATLGFALTMLAAWHHLQLSNLSVAKAGAPLQVVQEDELDDLKKELLGDDSSDDDDGDGGDSDNDKKDMKDTKDTKDKIDTADSQKFSRKPLDKFKQCGGGPDWAGSICCKKGCACVIRSMFYSMCQTPVGSGDCDEDAAKDEIRRAIIRAKAAPKKIPRLESLAKMAKKHLPDLKKKAEKASKDLKKILPEATKMHKAKEDAVKKATAARKKADDVSKTAGEKGKELWQTQHDNGILLSSSPPYSKTYYKVKGKVDALKKQTDDLTGRMKALNATAVKLEAIAKTVSTKANKVGTLHARAAAHARGPQRAYNRTKARADSLTAKLKRARNAVKYEAANVNIWRKVAKGDSCNEIIAEDVHSDPIVDYGGDEVSDEEAERAIKQEEDAQKKWGEERKRHDTKSHKHAKHLRHM